MGKPEKNQSFKDYHSVGLTSQVEKHDREYSSGRIDVVFKTHKCKSLKGVTRVKRGKGAWPKIQHH